MSRNLNTELSDLDLENAAAGKIYGPGWGWGPGWGNGYGPGWGWGSPFGYGPGFGRGIFIRF